jgi:hypothetical protein
MSVGDEEEHQEVEVGQEQVKEKIIAACRFRIADCY